MNPEIERYKSQLDILISFVEGELDGPALDVALATEEMAALLGVFENPRYPATTNYFRRLQNKQDRTTLDGLVNSEGIIEDFLQKAEVDFHPTKRFLSAYSLLLSALPNYLDPPLEFLTEKILPLDSGLSEAQKKKLVNERLEQYFKHLGKPPRWIQSPDWPIRDGQPLIFVGQLSIDAPDLFHDRGTAYLFYDSRKREFETVAQFY